MKDKTLEQYRYILRNDFAAFFRRSLREITPTAHYLFNWHVEVLAAKLEQVRRGEIRRLIINMAPRQGKSEIGSIVFPAFVLGHEPAKKIMCISYGQSLAEDLAHKSRALMQSPFYRGLFDTELLEERKAIADFHTTKGGQRMSESLSGSITGRGADLIIIDDPIKPEDVSSDVKRASLNTRFYDTISRRQNNKTGAIVIIMQRLHVEDIVAHVTGRELWDVVKLPVLAVRDEIYEVKTPYGFERISRVEGEALNPARDSAADWADQRKAMGEQVFAAQYQQDPLPIGGSVVKEEWLQYFDEPPEDYDRIIQSWDTASRDGAANSYNVCTTWKIAGKHFYLVDVYRQRGDFDKLKAAALTLCIKYNPSTIAVEAQANGNALISDLKERTKFNVVAATTTAGSKTARLEAVIDRFSGGFVHLLREANWLEEYVRELTAFPRTQQSDQVDSTVHALALVRPGDDGSNARAVEALRLMSDRGGELVRIFVPWELGSFNARDGSWVQRDAEGVAIVDRETAASLMGRFPQIKQL